MKRLFVLILLSIPTMVFSLEPKNNDFEGHEYVDESEAVIEEVGSTEAAKRPDTEKMLSELSSALKLSPKQEQKIAVLIKEWGVQFDGLMREHDKAQKKNKLDTMQAKQYEMKALNRDMPDSIRETLDDEQRQAYDEILEAKNNPAHAAERKAEEEANKVAEEKQAQEDKREEKAAEIASKKKERKDKETLRKVREKYGQPTFEIMDGANAFAKKDTFMLMIAVSMVRDSVTGNATRQIRNVCIDLNSETMDCRCGDGKSQKFVKETPSSYYNNAVHRTFICEPSLDGETKPKPKQHRAPAINEL